MEARGKQETVWLAVAGVDGRARWQLGVVRWERIEPTQAETQIQTGMDESRTEAVAVEVRSKGQL